MHRGTVGTCVLVVVATVWAVSLAGAAGPVEVASPVSAVETPDAVATGTPDTAADDGPERAANASLGAEISSFMQASSAEAERDVEDGRFEAALNRTDDEAARRALIEERIAELEARHERLRTRRGQLGATPDVRNRSIATRVAVGASGLERSLEGTERAAAEAGVDDERLAELRSNASAMTGPEVAELARGLAGPPGDDGGPPEDDRTGAPATPGSADPRSPDSRVPAGNASEPSAGNRSDAAAANAPGGERDGPPGGNTSDAAPGAESGGADDGPPGEVPEDGSTDDGPPEESESGPPKEAPGRGPQDGPERDGSADGSDEPADDGSDEPDDGSGEPDDGSDDPDARGGEDDGAADGSASGSEPGPGGEAPGGAPVR